MQNTVCSRNSLCGRVNCLQNKVEARSRGVFSAGGREQQHDRCTTQTRQLFLQQTVRLSVLTPGVGAQFCLISTSQQLLFRCRLDKRHQLYTTFIAVIGQQHIPTCIGAIVSCSATVLYLFYNCGWLTENV